MGIIRSMFIFSFIMIWLGIDERQQNIAVFFTLIFGTVWLSVVMWKAIEYPKDKY